MAGSHRRQALSRAGSTTPHHTKTFFFSTMITSVIECSQDYTAMCVKKNGLPIMNWAIMPKTEVFFWNTRAFSSDTSMRFGHASPLKPQMHLANRAATRDLTSHLDLISQWQLRGQSLAECRFHL
jgi:hypothetical protein